MAYKFYTSDRKEFMEQLRMELNGQSPYVYLRSFRGKLITLISLHDQEPPQKYTLIGEGELRETEEFKAHLYE